MSISSNRMPHRALRPWIWGPASIRWQVALAALLGVGLLFTLYVGAEATVRQTIRVFYTTIHELGHAIGALIQNGSVYDISIKGDASGHTHLSASDPVLTAAAGPVLPSWLAALLLYLAATRQANVATLAFLGVALLLSAYFAAERPEASLALYGLGSMALLFGVMPVTALIRSAVVFLFGFSLALGVLWNLSYLRVQYIDGDSSRPSDVQIISDGLGGVPIEDVRHVLLFIMLSGTAVTVIIFCQWITRRAL